MAWYFLQVKILKFYRIIVLQICNIQFFYSVIFQEKLLYLSKVSEKILKIAISGQVWRCIIFQIQQTLRILKFINIMQTTSSRIGREEQVKVVIRLKPDPQQKTHKCVYLSELENQLVVEADLKKQIFFFDHVAHQTTSQSDIYKIIGKQAVQSSFEGYNCSLFAYGQTGAGKTYSIFGDFEALQKNIYTESRGILPRLIEDIIEEANACNDQKYTLTCSYIEIYNEQILDLLSNDKRNHQIRENKKGIFIQGLKQSPLTSYRQGLELIMQGENSRKMAITTMNTQSSRSHVIFSIFVQSETVEEQRTIVKKSKLNVIDLAGSERIKHTNVQGDRLKQGCNINKSLHVLGNVINSLVQSAKKKKYIPYRDSKLTYYLKDSLGGNSITKLLANVHCSKEYFGDTLSTLMFAKRIKNLKMKVQLNMNSCDNFNNLRQQVRRLRSELASARYFKNQYQKSDKSKNQQDLSLTFQKITTDNTQFQVPRYDIVQVFQQNQLHYKALIQIYEEHMKECTNKSAITRRNSIGMMNQRKLTEQKNKALVGLVKNFPAFTKIFKENIILKQSRAHENYDSRALQFQESSKRLSKNNSFINIQDPTFLSYNGNLDIEEIVNKYQSLIKQLQQRFKQTLQTLQKGYNQLQSQCKRKDKKIKDILKSKDTPLDIQQLKNENQYLHLNILKLQNQIRKLQQSQNRLRLQNRQSIRNSVRNSKHQSFISHHSQTEENEEDLTSIIAKLNIIHFQAIKQAELVNQQKRQMQEIIINLKNQLSLIINQNSKLSKKYERSRSRKPRKQMVSTSAFKFEEISSFTLKDEKQHFSTSQYLVQNDYKAMQQNYSKQILALKLDMKSQQKQIVDLRNQVDSFMSSDFKYQQEFGKGVNQIIQEYRNLTKKPKNKQERQKIPKTAKHLMYDREKHFETVSKFDFIHIQQSRDPKSNHTKIQSRINKSKGDPKAKQQQLKNHKSSSKAKKGNYTSNPSSVTSSFFKT